MHFDGGGPPGPVKGAQGDPSRLPALERTLELCVGGGGWGIEEYCCADSGTPEREVGTEVLTESLGEGRGRESRAASCL